MTLAESNGVVGTQLAEAKRQQLLSALDLVSELMTGIVRLALRGELVEPVNPWVWYIDPATPEEWVPYFEAGILEWNGAFEDAGFKTPLAKLRTVAGIYPNYIQIVASADSGIKTLADLKGKRISVGAAKSGTELNARAIFKAAGLAYSDMAKVEYLPFGESVELMKNRQLDATLQSAGLGVASIRDLSTSVKIVVIPVPADVVAKVGDPAYQPAIIPANTYGGQTEAVATAAIPNFLVTHSGVPEDVVYRMTKAMYDNIDTLYAAHNAAKAIKRENAIKGMPVPLHPGAERYYKEAGFDIPAQLMPQ